MASAYDLNLTNQTMILEFEFTDSAITESLFSLNMGMANDNFLNNMPATATISNKSDFTGLNDQSEMAEPGVFVDHDGIHLNIKLLKSNQNLAIQIVDLTGRILYKRDVTNLSSGLQYFDLPFADLINPNRGIYILNLKTEDFRYSKKLLIK